MRTILYVSIATLALGLAGQYGLLGWTGGGSVHPLGKLVSRQQAVDLKEFYSAMAIVVGSTNDIASTGDFRDTQLLAVKIMQANTPGHLAGLEKLNGPINERLVAAIGDDNGEVPNAPLTAELRRKLQQALEKISEEF